MAINWGLYTGLMSLLGDPSFSCLHWESVHLSYLLVVLCKLVLSLPQLRCICSVLFIILNVLERQSVDSMVCSFAIKWTQAHELSFHEHCIFSSSSELPAEDTIGHTPGQVKTLGYPEYSKRWKVLTLGLGTNLLSFPPESEGERAQRLKTT